MITCCFTFLIFPDPFHLPSIVGPFPCPGIFVADFEDCCEHFISSLTKTLAEHLGQGPFSLASFSDLLVTFLLIFSLLYSNVFLKLFIQSAFCFVVVFFPQASIQNLYPDFGSGTSLCILSLQLFKSL